MAFDTLAIDKVLDKHEHNSSYSALEIYRSVSPLGDKLHKCMEQLDMNEMDTFLPAIDALRELLGAINKQAVRCAQLSLEDEEDFLDFANWIAFWGGLFGDEKAFNIAYPAEVLGELYDFWQLVVEFADSVLAHEGWNVGFSELIYGFSSGVALGNSKTHGLMAEFTGEKLNEIILIYRNSVDMFIELLTAAEEALTNRKL